MQVARFSPAPNAGIGCASLPPSLPRLFSLSLDLPLSITLPSCALLCRKRARPKTVGFGRFGENQLLMGGLVAIRKICKKKTCKFLLGVRSLGQCNLNAQDTQLPSIN